MFIEVFYLTQVALIPVIIEEFHLNLVEASLVATIPSLGALLTNIPAGFLADRLSADRVLFASMAIEGISLLVVSRAENFWMFVLALCFIRISDRLYHSSGLSTVSKVADQNQLNMALGLHNAFGNLGSAVGVLSLATFLSILGWRWVYVFWAGPVLAWAAIVLTSSELKSTRSGRTEEIRGTASLSSISEIFCYAFSIFLIAIIVREIGSTALSTFMTTYFVTSMGLSESLASMIFGVGPIMGIIGALAGGYLGDRVGSKKALSLTILGAVISLSLLAFMRELHLVALVYLVYAFFTYTVWSPITAIIAETTPSTARGLGYSVYFVAEGLMMSLAPVVAASVIELTEIWMIFPFSIGFLLASILIMQLLG